MVDMFFGPYKDTQALYVIKYGNFDSIIRIRYTGILNLPPVPKIEVKYSNKDDGDDVAVTIPAYDILQELYVMEKLNPILVGHVITFDGTGSSDPDGDELIYQWNFGDGNNSTSMSPSHVYNEVGEYRITLVVIDIEEQAQQTSITMVVGKPPTATILSPTEGKLFAVGEILRLKGEAFDYKGNRILDNQLSWNVWQHHADHFHPLLNERIGNDFDLFPAPEAEGFLATTSSFLEVIMYATDDNGLTTEISADIQPKTFLIDITTEPEGLEIIVDDYEVQTPTQITSWVDSDLIFKISNHPPYVFVGWSDGNTNTSRTVAMLSDDDDNNNGGKTNVTAIFCLDYAATCNDENSTASCCSEYCNEDGLCDDESEQETTIETILVVTENPSLKEEPELISKLPNETDVVPYTAPPSFYPSATPKETSKEDDIEPDKKPILSDASNAVEDEVTIELATSSTKLDSGQQDTTNSDNGLKVSGKWLIGLGGLVVLLLCLTPCYFGYKYMQLYRKLEAESKKSSSNESHKLPTLCSSMQLPPSACSKEDDITGIGSESNASVSSSGTDKIALKRKRKNDTENQHFLENYFPILCCEESDRRVKLRAKLSSSEDLTSSSETPGTMIGSPETLETVEIESPASTDSSFSTEFLTASIDETLLRLDDLLSKTFSRQFSRSSRRLQENNNINDLESQQSHQPADDSIIETELSEVDSDTSVDQSTFAPLWIASKNTSPLRETSAGNTVELNIPYLKGIHESKDEHESSEVSIICSQINEDLTTTSIEDTVIDGNDENYVTHDN